MLQLYMSHLLGHKENMSSPQMAFPRNLVNRYIRSVPDLLLFHFLRKGRDQILQDSDDSLGMSHTSVLHNSLQCTCSFDANHSQVQTLNAKGIKEARNLLGNKILVCQHGEIFSTGAHSECAHEAKHRSIATDENPAIKEVFDIKDGIQHVLHL